MFAMLRLAVSSICITRTPTNSVAIYVKSATTTILTKKAQFVGVFHRFLQYQCQFWVQNIAKLSISKLLQLSAVVRKICPRKFIFSSYPNLPGANNDVQAIGSATPASIAGPSGYVVNPSIGPMHRPGPNVHLPGYPTQPAPLAIHQAEGRMAQAVGYTAAHAAYPIIRQDRIQQAYSTYNAEVVVVEVCLTVKPPGRVKEMLIHVCAIQLAQTQRILQ